MGLSVKVWPVPVEIPSPIPFEQDTRHRSYDPVFAARWWRILVELERVFMASRCRFVGKASPVNFFWGSFDLALTRFSGRPAPPREGPAFMRDAYSHEVISHGFWPGSGPVLEPALYAYAVPEPPDLHLARVSPDAAYYHPELKEFILPYDAVRNAGERVVFGKPIIAYEQVQHRLAGIQAASTICSCALSYVAAMLDAHEAPEPFLDILIANIIKVTTTDLLQASAQSAVQLRGGQGFRKDHYTGKAFVDSRPFQIFEGSNDVLYEAIAAQLQGEARKGGDKTLAETLARHPELPAPKLPDDGVGGQPTQGEDSQVDRVLLGKIISRYSAIGIVQHAAGVRPELAESATAFLRAECDGWQNERTSRHRARYVP